MLAALLRRKLDLAARGLKLISALVASVYRMCALHHHFLNGLGASVRKG